MTLETFTQERLREFDEEFHVPREREAERGDIADFDLVVFNMLRGIKGDAKLFFTKAIKEAYLLGLERAQNWREYVGDEAYRTIIGEIETARKEGVAEERKRILEGLPEEETIEELNECPTYFCKEKGREKNAYRQEVLRLLEGEKSNEVRDGQ